MSKFLLIDDPLQMFALQTEHHLITVPYRADDGEKLVALRVEWAGGDEGETVVLTPDEAVRLAKRLLCAADGNGRADSLFHWQGDLEDRLFCDSRSVKGGKS